MHFKKYINLLCMFFICIYVDIKIEFHVLKPLHQGTDTNIHIVLFTFENCVRTLYQPSMCSVKQKFSSKLCYKKCHNICSFWRKYSLLFNPQGIKPVIFVLVEITFQNIYSI